MKNCAFCAPGVAPGLALAAALLTSAPLFSQTLPAPPLAEVVVTGSRVGGASDAQPFGTSVITAEDIRQVGAVTVNDALIRLLGIVGRQDFYGGGDYELDLRGFGETAASNQVVVVDGIRVNEADIGGTRLAGIPIDSVERIEVIRGSGTVLYGEGATGGVIVITTKAGMGSSRKNAASLYAATGSFGLREQRTSATLAQGGFSLDVNGANRDADNHRDNFQSRFGAVSATAQWSNDWLRLGVRQAQDQLDTGLPGELTAAEYAANPRQTSSPLDKASINNRRSGLFAQAVAGNWMFALDAGHRDKALRSLYVDPLFGEFRYDYNIKATGYGLRAVHDSKPELGSNKLVLGVDYGHWQRDILGADGVPTSQATQSSNALYGRNELTLAATGTTLSIGVRTERIDKNDNNPSASSSSVADTLGAWELGVVQPLSPTLSVYTRFGNSFRLASVDEFSFTSPGVALRPQRSRDMELGSRYAAGKLRLEARVYRSALTDEIGYDPDTFGPFSAFGSDGANVNYDPTRRSGLEIDGRYAYASNLNLRWNAALRKAAFGSGVYSGKDVPLTPRRSLGLHADWKLQPNQRLSGGVNWVASQFSDFTNQCTIPAYTTADVRYAYQWSQVELSLGITNLFDHRHYSQAFGCSAGVTTSIYPEPGRAATLALRVNF